MDGGRGNGGSCWQLSFSAGRRVSLRGGGYGRGVSTLFRCKRVLSMVHVGLRMQRVLSNGICFESMCSRCKMASRPRALDSKWHREHLLSTRFPIESTCSR